MSLCLRTVWTGGVIAVLFAMSATAAPPVFKEQNRSYGNSLYGGACNGITNGTICRDISAWENYDVKGMYQYSEAVITSSRYEYNPDDGSYRNGYRYLGCPIDQRAIFANPSRVTLEATLDPDAPGCNSWGYMESWDPINGYQFESWTYPVPMNIAGEWLDPFSYGESTSNNRNVYFDGWSGVTSSSIDHCKHNWGDVMRAGGFSVNQRYFAFEGPSGPAWSFYSLVSCNSNNKQR